MARIWESENHSISSWTGFNIMTRNQVSVVEDNIGYLPTINAPATDISTVNEILNQSVNIPKSLEVNEIVCVFDQALYT